MRISRWALVACVSLLIGCADTVARQAALLGSEQLAAVEGDLATKVAAESRYYDEILDQTAADLSRSRRILIQDQLTRSSRTFAASHKNAAANDKLAGDLRKFLSEFVSAWREDEAAREKVLADTRKTLLEGRQQLKIEKKKYRQLRSKLTTLGEAKTPKALFDFLVSYGKETGKALDKLEKDAVKAEKAAGKK